MCVVSNVHDHYQQKWPFPVAAPSPLDQLAQKVFSPAHEKSAIELFEEIVRLTKKLDAVLGLPDCESAHKTEWMEKVRERIRQAEAAKLDKRLGA